MYFSAENLSAKTAQLMGPLLLMQLISLFAIASYMSQKSIDFKYIHQIKGHSKEGKKEHDVSAIADFYNEQIGKIKGLKGFLLMENVDDRNEIINSTFWETKEDCDVYLSQDKTYTAILEKTASFRDGALERTNYTLAKFRIS